RRRGAYRPAGRVRGPDLGRRLARQRPDVHLLCPGHRRRQAARLDQRNRLRPAAALASSLMLTTGLAAPPLPALAPRLLGPEPGWAETTDVVVVGSGIAGLTAALHLRQAGRPVTVVTKANH